MRIVEEKISDEEVQLKVKKSGLQTALDTFAKVYSHPNDEPETLALQRIEEYRSKRNVNK